MTLPTITLVMPVRNEEDYLEACLDSIVATTTSDSQLELLIYDGASTDRSREIIGEYVGRHPWIQLLANPERFQSWAFNRGVAAARGEFLIRLDAHTVYAPDYIAECVRLLGSSGASNVGGVQRSVGTTPVTRAIAAAVASPFAAGDAKYRYATEPTFADTVYLGAWRTETIRRLGGMRVEWLVNEDYELNIRLREQGGTILVSPTIQCEYAVRPGLRPLARQYFRYGMWKIKTLWAHPRSFRWRQAIAPGFVLYLIAAAVTFRWLGPIVLGPLALYGLGNAAASWSVIRRVGTERAYLIPVLFLLIHLSWGSGFLVGLVRFIRPRPG